MIQQQHQPRYLYPRPIPCPQKSIVVRYFYPSSSCSYKQIPIFLSQIMRNIFLVIRKQHTHLNTQHNTQKHTYTHTLLELSCIGLALILFKNCVFRNAFFILYFLIFLYYFHDDLENNTFLETKDT